MINRINQRIKELGKSVQGVSVEATGAKETLRKILNGTTKSPRMDTISKLAAALDTTPEWLAGGDPSANPPSKPNASFPPQYQTFPTESYIKILGQTAGGPNGRFLMNGEEVGRVFTPPNLEGVKGAYAVRVFGTSMEPRFKAGETVWLNPNEPVRSGDDVVIQMRTTEEDGRESYIKEFRSMSSKVLRLWQHNPEDGEKQDLEFETRNVLQVHKVVYHAML
jgi:phage repressor protein C with HTH and peptisase S24 domain